MRSSVKALQDRRASRGQHPGLLLQRYLSEPACGEDGNPEEKRALLKAAIAASRDEELSHLYAAAFDRWSRSLPELTAAGDMRAEGRLIVGLGSANVLETGIRLHHIYGLPVIPGSALKGLAAHYCDRVWGERDANSPAAEAMRFRGPRGAEAFRGTAGEPAGDYHRLIFGATDDGGCVTFHDAWLLPPDPSGQPLLMDVMTPHHPNWQDGSVPPTDFDSPTPVPFLSVQGTFRVAVSWQGPEGYDKAVAWTSLAFELLAAALADWGAGGKTSSGYGRMIEPESDKRRKPFSAAALGLPAVGFEVEAILKEAPKKGKPWRASVRLRSGELSGPIDGAPPAPASLQPGRPVRVTVTEVSERSIRFRWPPAPKMEG